MIKFFRTIRRKLLLEGKSVKYAKYAVGEIFLVVIGILIALQINNANERSKQNKQLIKYEQNIISELKDDLRKLDGLDSLNGAKIQNIHDYLSYFSQSNRDIDTVIKKMYEIQYNGAVYRSIAYTIDEIINTGNLSLFSSEKKNAILELRAIQEFYERNRLEVEQKWVLSSVEFEKAIDLVAFRNHPAGGIIESGDWRYDLNSEQYRLYNNKTLAELRVFYFRTDQNDQMRSHSEKLLGLLEKN